MVLFCVSIIKIILIIFNPRYNNKPLNSSQQTITERLIIDLITSPNQLIHARSRKPRTNAVIGAHDWVNGRTDSLKSFDQRKPNPQYSPLANPFPNRNTHWRAKHLSSAVCGELGAHISGYEKSQLLGGGSGGEYVGNQHKLSLAREHLATGLRDIGTTLK